MSSVQKHTLRIVEDIVDGVSQWFSYRFFFWTGFKCACSYSIILKIVLSIYGWDLTHRDNKLTL